MRRIIIYPPVQQDAAPLRLLTTGIWFAAASAMRLRAHERFDTTTASFAITFHEETSAYRDTAILVLPRAAVVFNAVSGLPGDCVAATAMGLSRSWGRTSGGGPHRIVRGT
jgi:hypothetical protein